MATITQAFSDEELQEMEQNVREIVEMGEEEALIDITATEVLELVTEARAWRASQRKS